MRRGKKAAWRNRSPAMMRYRRGDRWGRVIKSYLRITPIAIEGASEAVKAYGALSRALERMIAKKCDINKGESDAHR